MKEYIYWLQQAWIFTRRKKFNCNENMLFWRKNDEKIWNPPPPISKRTPLSTNPLFLRSFFMTPRFVQISKTRGGGNYVSVKCVPYCKPSYSLLTTTSENTIVELSQPTFQRRIKIEITLIRHWKWNKIRHWIFNVARRWYNVSARRWNNVDTTLFQPSVHVS